MASAKKLGDLARIDHVSTGGGALIRFLSGVNLPLLEAMRKARARWEGSTLRQA